MDKEIKIWGLLTKHAYSNLKDLPPHEAEITIGLEKLESLMKERLEKDKTIIKWKTPKDALCTYSGTYFGECPCGNGNVIVSSKYCSECGKKIVNQMKDNVS